MNVFDEHKLTVAGARQCGELLKATEAERDALAAELAQWREIGTSNAARIEGLTVTCHDGILAPSITNWRFS